MAFETNKNQVIHESDWDLFPPSLFSLTVFANEYTPLDFLVKAISIVFRLDGTSAKNIAIDIVANGFYTFGFFAKDVAETKLCKICDLVSEEEHPLVCKLEEKCTPKN